MPVAASHRAAQSASDSTRLGPAWGQGLSCSQPVGSLPCTQVPSQAHHISSCPEGQGKRKGCRLTHSHMVHPGVCQESGGGSHDCLVIPGSLDPRAQIRVCNTWEKGQGGPQGWGRPSEHEEQPWAPLSSGARGQGGVPWRHPGGLRQTSVSPLTPGHSQLYRLGVRLRTGKPSRAVTGLPPSLLIPSSS